MNKELIKEFVQECKQEQEWRKRWNANHIKLDNYFVYSGEVEKKVPMTKKVISFKAIKTDCEILSFWFENPDYTTEEVGRVFGCPVHTVKRRLNEYFDSKKIYNACD